MIMQMSLSILFQVHTHSLNMNNLVTQLRISYLGLWKCMSHFHISCTISNYLFRLKEIAAAYPANPVRLLKALITKDSGGKWQDAPSNNCNQSNNVGQSSKVVSKDAKHDNKGQNKWYVYLCVDTMDMQTHIPPQASGTFWCPPNLATTSWGSWSCWWGLGITQTPMAGPCCIIDMCWNHPVQGSPIWSLPWWNPLIQHPWCMERLDECEIVEGRRPNTIEHIWTSVYQLSHWSSIKHWWSWRLHHETSLVPAWKDRYFWPSAVSLFYFIFFKFIVHGGLCPKVHICLTVLGCPRPPNTNQHESNLSSFPTTSSTALHFNPWIPCYMADLLQASNVVTIRYCSTLLCLMSTPRHWCPEKQV